MPIPEATVKSNRPTLVGVLKQHPSKFWLLTLLCLLIAIALFWSGYGGRTATISVRFEEGHLHFLVDSDAHIVRGLLMLVMAAYEGKTPAEISAFDVNSYFQQLDLEQHLSPTRGNGLRAIVAKIQAIASASLANA